MDTLFNITILSFPLSDNHLKAIKNLDKEDKNRINYLVGEKKG